jgi:hypothetical protein
VYLVAHRVGMDTFWKDSLSRRGASREKAMSVPHPPVYYVVFVVTIYESLEDAIAKVPDVVAAHLARSSCRVPS